MNHSSLRHYLLISLLILAVPSIGQSQKRRPPTGGLLAVVIDQRLAVLRETPSLSARLVRRLSRGRLVAIRKAVIAKDGVVFYRVIVTRRTSGWLQREAIASPNRTGDDERFYRLLLATQDFDRIAGARVFLDLFPNSKLRPAVLLLYAAAADAAAEKLSLEASRKLEVPGLSATGAPEFSYFLNYSGLDRYNRQGVRFVFQKESRKFLYDGAAWRELARRYPRTNEGEEARARLMK